VTHRPSRYALNRCSSRTKTSEHDMYPPKYPAPSPAPGSAVCGLAPAPVEGWARVGRERLLRGGHSLRPSRWRVPNSAQTPHSANVGVGFAPGVAALAGTTPTNHAGLQPAIARGDISPTLCHRALPSSIAPAALFWKRGLWPRCVEPSSLHDRASANMSIDARPRAGHRLLDCGMMHA
jgi:hypothetical protein